MFANLDLHFAADGARFITGTRAINILLLRSNRLPQTTGQWCYLGEAHLEVIP